MAHGGKTNEVKVHCKQKPVHRFRGDQLINTTQKKSPSKQKQSDERCPASSRPLDASTERVRVRRKLKIKCVIVAKGKKKKDQDMVGGDVNEGAKDGNDDEVEENKDRQRYVVCDDF